MGQPQLRITADGYLDDEREISVVDGQVYGLDISLRERPAILTVRTDDGADVTVDGRIEGSPRCASRSRCHRARTSSRSASADTTRIRPRSIFAATKSGRSTSRSNARRSAMPRSPRSYRGGLRPRGRPVHRPRLPRRGRRQGDRDAKVAGNLSEEERFVHEQAVANREDLKKAAGGAFGAAGLFTLVALGLYAFDHPAPAFRSSSATTPRRNRPRPTAAQGRRRGGARRRAYRRGGRSAFRFLMAARRAQARGARTLRR